MENFHYCCGRFDTSTNTYMLHGGPGGGFSSSSCFFVFFFCFPELLVEALDGCFFTEPFEPFFVELVEAESTDAASAGGGGGAVK